MSQTTTTSTSPPSDDFIEIINLLVKEQPDKKSNAKQRFIDLCINQCYETLLWLTYLVKNTDSLDVQNQSIKLIGKLADKSLKLPNINSEHGNTLLEIFNLLDDEEYHHRLSDNSRDAIISTLTSLLGGYGTASWGEFRTRLLQSTNGARKSFRDNSLKLIESATLIDYFILDISCFGKVIRSYFLGEEDAETQQRAINLVNLVLETKKQKQQTTFKDLVDREYCICILAILSPADKKYTAARNYSNDIVLNQLYDALESLLSSDNEMFIRNSLNYITNIIDKVDPSKLLNFGSKIFTILLDRFISFKESKEELNDMAAFALFMQFGSLLGRNHFNKYFTTFMEDHFNNTLNERNTWAQVLVQIFTFYGDYVAMSIPTLMKPVVEWSQENQLTPDTAKTTYLTRIVALLPDTAVMYPYLQSVIDPVYKVAATKPSIASITILVKIVKISIDKEGVTKNTQDLFHQGVKSSFELIGTLFPQHKSLLLDVIHQLVSVMQGLVWDTDQVQETIKYCLELDQSIYQEYKTDSKREVALTAQVYKENGVQWLFKLLNRLHDIINIVAVSNDNSTKTQLVEKTLSDVKERIQDALDFKSEGHHFYLQLVLHKLELLSNLKTNNDHVYELNQQVIPLFFLHFPSNELGAGIGSGSPNIALDQEAYAAYSFWRIVLQTWSSARADDSGDAKQQLYQIINQNQSSQPLTNEIVELLYFTLRHTETLSTFKSDIETNCPTLFKFNKTTKINNLYKL
ncbi:hypothetical protein DFA_08530 [Cavenderia fasciculata]|uniref:Uncharacterized protein n=1 Tax=Cavenderia fasciculata TaxID=261658 RepID=F4Q2R7_CACFS|nr:uncharacterized protein DFA_08530 [Cavenderia fasciculata]EGG17534.1 hypothetical protein DFA_08530 [Cavenderia fasciculata]|eukprot:XP_004356018.1 hypothetical protein DFA_08530 [Cavenderia fasciculata]